MEPGLLELELHPQNLRESSINNTGQLVQLGPTVQVKLSTAEVARMPSDFLLTGPPFELKAAIAGTVWRLSVPLGSASLVFCTPGNHNTPKETAFLGWFHMSWPSMMSMQEVSSCRVAFYWNCSFWLESTLVGKAISTYPDIYTRTPAHNCVT